jgi:sec-independent protein translocase protein TatB
MLDIGFSELLLIAIIAILFLGPDKLPGALVDMAKFIKSIKKTIGDAKNSLEEEMKIAELKEEALGYKKQLDDATNELKNFKNIDFDSFANTTYETDISTESPGLTSTQVERKNELITFKKTDKATSSKGQA